jgi:hypothetical protein
VVKEGDLPSVLEQFNQGKDAYNLVLGAMLGAYLGLTISRSGLSGGSYQELGAMLVCCSLFVAGVNKAGDQVHRGGWLLGLVWGVVSLIPGFVTFKFAERLDLDGGIILTIFSAWYAVVLLEVLTLLPSAITQTRGRSRD